MNTIENEVKEVTKVYDSIWARNSHPELSVEKEKLKRIFLDRGISIEGKMVLDCGCGSGMTSIAFAQLGAKEVLGLDNSGEAVRLAESMAKEYGIKNVSFRKCSLLEPLDFGRKFDIVYAFAVLHHTGGTRKAFKYVAKCCQKGGALLVSLYLKTWLTPFWKIICFLYRKSPATIKKIFNGSLIEIIRLHDRVRHPEGVIIDHSIEQQVKEWFELPIRSHHSYKEVEGWFIEEGFLPELVLPKIARFKSTTNFVMNGIKL